MIESTDIAELKALIVSLQAEIQRLRAENEELKTRLTQNSNNSHKSPASDGLAKKAIKLAFPSDKSKKQGGQPGHPGKTLLMTHTPDSVIEHRTTHCQQCGQDLTKVTPTVLQRRQVFDLPQPRLYVEEHRQVALLCACGCVNTGHFPAWVAGPVQYGPRIQAQSILLNIDYKLPFAKVTQLWTDLTGYACNPATLTHAQTALYEQLGPLEDQVKVHLQAAQVCHFDETGLRVGGQLQWLHVACSAFFTFLFVHPSRGQKALKATRSVFEGCANCGSPPGLVHDCWSSYFVAGKGRHALCGAHLLRELQGQIDRGRAWAALFHEYLLALYKASRSGPLAANERRSWQQAYRQLCEQGLEEELPPLVFYHKSGKVLNKRPKQSSGRNLLDRLVAHQEAVLAFAFEEGVPFTNNEAERALRPAKIKQKVSGGFRTQAGAHTYARITGFIATMRKQECNVVEQLADVLQGRFQWAT